MTQYTVAFSTCALHAVHIPESLVAHMHHTFPKYLQARAYGLTEEQMIHDPRFDGTLVSLCPTGHDNVHELIQRMMRGEKAVNRKGKTHKMALYAVEQYRGAGGK